MYKCSQGLRQARAQEELRICHDACALREAYAKARTNGRVTEGQLCWCFWSMCGNISSALPKGTPVPYLSQMSQIRNLLFKMPIGTEIHLKYILGFSIICFKLNFFFSRRQHTRMLKDYRIIHWWLSEGISKLLSMYNNRYQPKGTQFYFSVWFGFFCLLNFTWYWLNYQTFIHLHIHLQKFFFSVGHWSALCRLASYLGTGGTACDTIQV